MFSQEELVRKHVIPFLIHMIEGLLAKQSEKMIPEEKFGSYSRKQGMLKKNLEWTESTNQD